MTAAHVSLWPDGPDRDSAAALRYLDRAKAMLAAEPKLALAQAAVAGGGPLATGFAVALARAGVRVTLIEDDAHDLRRVRDLLARADAMAGITLCVDLAAAKGADLVVEAGQTQRSTRLETLHALAAPDALLVALGADPLPGFSHAHLVQIDTATPPPNLTLLEIITPPTLRPETRHRAEGLARLLGAIPVPTQSPIAARLLARLEDTAEALIFHGSTPWELDAALEACGFTLGPCAAQDLRGLDLAYARHRRLDAAGTQRAVLPVLDRMVPEGRLGHKGGVGWYRYPGGGGRVIDPLIEDLAREEAHFAGVTPQPIPAEILRDRVLHALINEAAQIQALGVPAPLVDLICVHATGFPAALGGPLFAAQRLWNTPTPAPQGTQP